MPVDKASLEAAAGEQQVIDKKRPGTLLGRRRRVFLLGTLDPHSPLAQLREAGSHLLELVWKAAHQPVQ